ncbi:Putative peptidase, M23/M37 family [Moritella viscosa]|uniref:Putative peptidase, M23/M37 family n=1 Tax=Moritella viscosa TaxID=80854 RepID=A0A090KCK6_9GAMM|nr:peptidoglycan DD-metalloendopeptidase family protein [Moritella viscosa]CED61593.1 peptidase, M23/M37 family [Moritella viscosa]SGY98008.1 Putative peptidase, M23/M37 family [Moritella viscosa]SHO05070.1 Putative peptidase, M23/M37 family [Moritella viscosa]SHO05990.1 Putative peptidase, M23/M37 family [Moritella viscosa]SHO08187.1 Putative peptidase, M23/M37 family [Moritella viscosa]
MSFGNRFKQLPKQHRTSILIIFGLIITLLLLPVSTSAPQSSDADSFYIYQVGDRYSLKLPRITSAENKPVKSRLTSEEIIVRAGDNLSLIGQRSHLSTKTIYEIDKLSSAKRLRSIYPGQKLTITTNNDGQFVELIYPYSATESLHINKTADGYTTNTVKNKIEVREIFTRAEITSNFWNAGVKGKMPAKQIMNLATIFGWDIDFALDIRAGDSFAVIYEEQYIDGYFVSTGNILAAEFINQGDKFQAVRHKDGSYYTPSGRSMRKAFLRAPVNFKYISSSFNRNRRHPVTGRVRAHNGIDYAARTGTPIVSAGDGKVIASAYNRFNGNYVFIKHNANIVTKYLHMNKRSVRQGQRVKQNQKIGTVGATGRVTGPHLHYEFLVNGKHKNPKTVSLPKAESLRGSEKTKFVSEAKGIIEQLENNAKLYSLIAE